MNANAVRELANPFAPWPVSKSFYLKRTLLSKPWGTCNLISEIKTVSKYMYVTCTVFLVLLLWNICWNLCVTLLSHLGMFAWWESWPWSSCIFGYALPCLLRDDWLKNCPSSCPLMLILIIMHRSKPCLLYPASALSLKELLRNHRFEYLHAGVEEVQVRVHSKHIWKDGITDLSRSFDLKKHIEVKFVGEKAVDGGGPQRDFFTHLMAALNHQNALLDGPADNRVLQHNSTALDKDSYFHIGKIIAMSVIHGGPAPNFLAQPVLDYLFHGSSGVTSSIEDVPDRYPAQAKKGEPSTYIAPVISQPEILSSWNPIAYLFVSSVTSAC